MLAVGPRETFEGLTQQATAELLKGDCDCRKDMVRIFLVAMRNNPQATPNPQVKAAPAAAPQAQSTPKAQSAPKVELRAPFHLQDRSPVELKAPFRLKD